MLVSDWEKATGLKLTDVLETRASGLLVLTQDWQIARKLIGVDLPGDRRWRFRCGIVQHSDPL